MIPARSLLVLLSIIVVSFACTCRDSGPEAAYCKAEFVSKIKVDQVYELARNNHTYDYLYTVKHLTTFKKGPAHLDEEIRSPFHESMCGVKLRKGEEVVVAGTLTSCGFLRIDSCNRIPPTFDVNKFKKINCSTLVVI